MIGQSPSMTFPPQRRKRHLSNRKWSWIKVLTMMVPVLACIIPTQHYIYFRLNMCYFITDIYIMSKYWIFWILCNKWHDIMNLFLNNDYREILIWCLKLVWLAGCACGFYLQALCLNIFNFEFLAESGDWFRIRDCL